MKKIALVLLIALIGCSKEQDGQCSICTVTITDDLTGANSTTVKQTERHGQSSGACSMSQDEFKSELASEASNGVEVLNAQGINATYSVDCAYE